MINFRNHPDLVSLPRNRTTVQYLRLLVLVALDKQWSYRLTSVADDVQVPAAYNRKILPGRRFLNPFLPPYNTAGSRALRQIRSGEPGYLIPASLNGSHRKHIPGSLEHPEQIHDSGLPQF